MEDSLGVYCIHSLSFPLGFIKCDDLYVSLSLVSTQNGQQFGDSGDGGIT